jgi:hypothetical protein
MPVASIEDPRRAFVRWHDRRVPSPDSRVIRHTTGPRAVVGSTSFLGLFPTRGGTDLEFQPSISRSVHRTLSDASMIESSRTRLRNGTKVFVSVALVMVSTCDNGEIADGSHPTTSPPPVRELSVQVSSCTWSREGELVLVLSLAGSGTLRGSSLDATTDTPVMTVEGTFPHGDHRIISWSTETTRTDETMRLSLNTSVVPSSLSISNLTFTVLMPTDVRAVTLGGLENKELTLEIVYVRVNGIDPLEGAVGIEFELSPLIYASRLLVNGVQGVTVGVGASVMKGQGFTAAAPGGDSLVQRIVLPVLEGSVPSIDAGPADLSIEGLILQVTGAIETAIPENCRS